MKALSLSMGPTIISNMFSKWFDDALVFVFCVFFSFEDSVRFSSLHHLICPLETFKYWSNHESFCFPMSCNFYAQSLLTRKLIFELQEKNKTTPPQKKTENVFIKIFHSYVGRITLHFGKYFFFPSRNRLYTFTLINFYFQAQQKLQYKKQMCTLDSFKLNFQKQSLF